ncbi:hypothetical protein [Mangrovibacter plantisponsor]|nr:hypothetical protein [Mangrovibacter plantisponsor]
MFKLLKWVILLIISVFILGLLLALFIASGINESTTYTEKDFFYYHFVTDKDIAKAPRISGDYYFKSYPGDGYAPSNAIIFRGVTSIKPLRDYLIQLGYTRSYGGVVQAELWAKPNQGNGDCFYLHFNTATGEAELTKELNN